MSQFNQSWNYEEWKAGIDILYGEGKAKYSDEESQEVEKVKVIIGSSINRRARS